MSVRCARCGSPLRPLSKSGKGTKTHDLGCDMGEDCICDGGPTHTCAMCGEDHYAFDGVARRIRHSEAGSGLGLGIPRVPSANEKLAKLEAENERLKKRVEELEKGLKTSEALSAEEWW